MKNTIAERIADFLSKYPPFHEISEEDNYRLAQETQVIYLEKGQNLFKQGEIPNGYFYIVHQGAVRLYKSKNQNEITELEICDEGDIFGLRPLIIKENYNLSAQAFEESIIYALPIEVFHPLYENNASISKYLVTRFAANTEKNYSTEENNKIFEDYTYNSQDDFFSSQCANYTETPISCSETASIQEAAKIMSAKKIGSILIEGDNLPKGIITNKDLMHKVATGKVNITENVSKIMSSPVITASKDITIAEAQILMLRKKIGNICITEDGSSNTHIMGILTQGDILATYSNNPKTLIKQANKANSIIKLRETRLQLNALLKRYLEQKISFAHIVNIVSEVNEVINCRVIELAIEEMNCPPPTKFSWIAMGSQGRREQLVATDQDNAIIYKDVEESKQEIVKAYFLELAEQVNHMLHSIGYEYCPAEMMASNPKWCLSLSEWKQQFETWIFNPSPESILLSSVFFDFNYVYGSKKLVSKLSQSVFNNINSNQYFFKLLAEDAIKSPSPLGFFRNFIVEQNGVRKDQFNIKQRALMPLIDAARILSLSLNLEGVNNTMDRYKRLGELEPQNKEVYDSCAFAFKALLKFKTLQGLSNSDLGRFIELDKLSKEDKLKLRRCFKPIKNIQEILTIRFQLKS